MAAATGALAGALSAAVLAVPVSASAASTSPAASAGATETAGISASGSADGTAPADSAPSKAVCAAPQPGYAACDALIRTDAAGHQGELAPGVTPAGYGPADLQSAYALPSATAGEGATVAVVDAYDDPTAETDLAVYRSQYGLPPCTTANGCFRKINQDGGSEPPARSASWATEISLDLDMVSAVCPNCHILLVEADDASIQNLGTAVNQAVAQGARFVSNSYTASLSYQDPVQLQWDSEWYNHPGVVIAAASGDAGWSNPANFPAASPHVVAVGGTTLTRDASSPRGWDESVWDGTGSGCSTVLAKPAWQTDTGCSGRTANDVAAVADPDTGVAVYDSYGVQGWAVVGGTSAATPIVTSVYALAGSPVAGTYPASYLYANASALNDVTTGDNWELSGADCQPYPAYICNGETGYDAPTGEGTPEGVAAFQAGPHGEVAGTVRDSRGRPLAGVTVSIGSATTVTDSAGRYDSTALASRYTATAVKFGYGTGKAAVRVTSGGSATADFTLTAEPTATVSGTVKDASGQGWPLYAQIQVAGTPVTTYTNPVTGSYRITLPVTGKAYTLDTSAVYSGYLASDARVAVTEAGATKDIGLKVDPAAGCAAPGYKPAYQGLRETFSSKALPSGWTLNGAGWTFDNPDHRANLTGGAGGFALADGFSASTATPFTSYLTLPVLDLSGDTDPVLQFSTDLQNDLGGAAYVLVSTDGAHWQYVFSSDVNGTGTVDGPATETIPLPMMAGQSSVYVQFEAASGTDQLSWEIDNVFVGTLRCKAVTGGGLVVGQVRDRNTSQPVDGATVSVSGSTATAITAPAPGDPAVGGGLFWLYAPAGPATLTASDTGYSPGTAGVSVASGAVTRASLALAAPRISMSGRVAVAAPMGGKTVTGRLTVANTGSAPATVSLDPQQGPFTLAGSASVNYGATAGTAGSTAGTAGTAGREAGTAAGTATATAAGGAAGTPLRMVSGHYGPGLAGTADGPQELRAQAAPAPAAGNSWTPVAHFLEDQYDVAAATDPATGLVYAVGGTQSAEAFVFRPATGNWSQLPSMNAEREAPAAAFIGGRLYVTAGYDVADTTTATSLQIYDPQSGTWSAGAPIPHAYYGSATAVVGGKMYVVGGCDATDDCAYRTVQVYDPATNTWAQAARYPRQIAFAACGGIDGKLYCAGGYVHAAGKGTAAADVYDPQANTWSPVASMPADLWGATYTSADGQLLVSGGITHADQELTNEGFAYDPASNTWTDLPNAPQAVYRGGSACGLYQVGGIVDSDGFQAVTDDAEQLPGYGDCDGGAGVPWLSLSQSQLTLAPGQHATVTVTLDPGDPAVSQPGTYAATLLASASTPYLPSAATVTMTAAPPRTWGELEGTVSGTSCAGETSPLPGVAVQVTSAAGSWTLTTDTDGKYATWLDASDSPLTVITAPSGWVPQAATASLTAGRSTSLNLTLSPAGC